MMRRTMTGVFVVAAAVAAAACVNKQQSAAALSGPSELSTSITISASPDVLTQDGASQAQIAVLARDARSLPIANLAVHLDVSAGSSVADAGSLSTSQVVTGADGRATAVYTAPRAPQTTAGLLGAVLILATPVGTNASSTIARSITIRLTSPGNVAAPSNAPVADFTFSPTNPIGSQTVYFNAADSTSSVPIATYAWDFGDGSAAGTGVSPAHRFNGCTTGPTNTTDQTFVVRLTVTDSVGSAGAIIHPVTITGCR
ncbi:MAG: PKD domain-containing protein [Acidobacteriota bacterium]